MIQKSNIERFLADNLPAEVKALTEKISETRDSLLSLQARCNLLTNIAEVAGVDLTEYLPNGTDGRDSDESNRNSSGNQQDYAALVAKKVEPSAATFR